MMKKKGENWNSASNARWPCTLRASRPKNTSTLAPNCTVFDVTAK